MRRDGRVKGERRADTRALPRLVCLLSENTVGAVVHESQLTRLQLTLLPPIECQLVGNLSAIVPLRSRGESDAKFVSVR